MKKIIYLIIASLCFFSSDAQITEKQLLDATKKEIVEDKSLLPSQKEEILRKSSASFKLLRVPIKDDKKSRLASSINIFETDILINPCTNSDFEFTDTTNFISFGWKGFGASSYSKFALGFVANDLYSGLVPPSIISPGFKQQTVSTLPAAPGSMATSFGGSYHSIETSGFDSHISVLAKSISGNSIRLGNDNARNGAEIISKTFIVPLGMNKFRFQYALVCNPDDGNAGFFNAKAVDNFGNVISEIMDMGKSTNPFFLTSSGLYYRPWHVAELDLSSLIGQKVTIIITNTDCFGWGHYQYVYLDDFCTTDKNTQEGFIEINPIDSCNSFPITFSGNFALPNIVGNPVLNPTISVGFYQAGVLVCSKTIPAPTTGLSYSLTASTLDCPSLSGCADVVATLSYKLKDMNGVLQTVNITTGNPKNGIRPGQDNDFCKCCTCSQSLSPTLYWNNNTDSSSLQCNSTVTDKLECYKNYIVKVKNPCGPDCTDYEVLTTITYPNGLVQTSTSTAGVPITVGSLIGSYTVSIKVKCNGKWCEECKIIFKQTKPCKPACDNCKNQDGSPKVQAVFNTGSSTSVVNTFPAGTTINAAFMLGGGTDTYTQVRVNILDVQMMSGKYDNAGNFVPGLAECLQCYNNPNQWGSILSGTFSLPAFVPSSTTYGSIPTTNAFNNSREITFTSNTAAAIPMGTGFNLSLQLPGVNPLSCCCITTKVFLKITYRNNKCEECSRVVVVDFTQCPGGNGDAGSSSTGGNGGTGTGVFNSAGGHPQYRISSPNKDVAPSKNNN